MIRKKIYPIFASLCLILLSTCEFYEYNDLKGLVKKVTEINIVNKFNEDRIFLANGEDAKFLTDSYKIVFIQNNDLYSMNYDGSQITRLTRLQTVIGYTPSLGSSRIVLSAYRDIGSYIYMVDLAGDSMTQITGSQGSYDATPDIAPDLQAITFSRNGSICRSNSIGGEFITIKTGSSENILSNPHFIFDRNRILFLESKKNSFMDSISLHIFYVPLSKDSILINFKAPLNAAINFDVNADGKILFISRGLSNVDSLKVYDIITGEIHVIDKCCYANFSGSGDKVIYSDNRNIYLSNLDGSGKQIVYVETDTELSIANPRLAIDGNRIIFERIYYKAIN